MATIIPTADVQGDCGMDPASLDRIGAWQQALVDGGERRATAWSPLYTCSYLLCGCPACSPSALLHRCLGPTPLPAPHLRATIGHLPMAISVVSRHGKVAYTQATGYSDAEGKVPIKDDDIFRLYSMTKPPVAVGLLMLYDEGRFQLDDPVWYFLGPKWKRENVRVFDAWTDRKATEYTTVSADREITMRE